MKNPGDIVVELIYKKSDVVLSHYMDKAVRQFLEDVPKQIDYRLTDIQSDSGKERYLELSVSLYGKEAVHKKLMVAPLPSLFINGDLVFETIPSQPMLVKAFESYLTGVT